MGLAAPARAVIQGDDGKIAFQSNRSGVVDVWIADPPSGGVRPMAGNDPAARDERPAWAPPAPLMVLGIGTAREGPPLLEITIAAERREDTPTSGVSVRWPGLAGDFPTTPAEPGRFLTHVPPGAKTGHPCISVAGSGSVREWPARLLSPFLIRVGDTEPEEDTRRLCDQPLAFQSDRLGRWDVWLFDPATGAVRNATEDAPNSDELAPAWSSRMGTTTDRISARPKPLLAFASNRTGDFDIFLSDPLASADTAVNVTRSPDFHETNPDWSPDGRWLTFERHRGGEVELWILEIDPVTNLPSTLRRITTGLGPSEEPSWFEWSIPHGLPPADEIALSGRGAEGDLDMHHVLAPTGTEPFLDPLSVSEWTETSAPYDEVQPAWAPIGSELLYASNRPADALDTEGDFDIFALSETGGDDEVVISGPGDDLHPAWQPLMLPASVAPRRPRGRATPRRRAKASVIVPPGTLQQPAQPSETPQTQPRCTHAGTPGPDVLVGTAGADVICGRGGKDRLVGGGGDDRLLGGGGADDLRGGGGRDDLRGGGGADDVRGGGGADKVRGDSGADLVVGGSAEDDLMGGRGHDRLRAVDGRADLLLGGAGSDDALVDRKGDRVIGVERVTRR